MERHFPRSGNSSAQTVDDHVLVNGRTRKRSAAGGWSEAEVCAEELPLRGGPCMEDNAAASGSGQGLAIFSLRLLQGLGCEAKFECTLLH